MSTSKQYRILWAPIALWLMVSLAGCGVLATPTLSADKVHQAYLDALQHNDRTKLLAFSGDETYKNPNADRRLEKSALRWTRRISAPVARYPLSTSCH